jgi:hypothetical protein
MPAWPATIAVLKDCPLFLTGYSNHGIFTSSIFVIRHENE